MWESEGVRRGSNRGLREGGRGWKRKNMLGEVERVNAPDLESWREAFEG